MVELLVAHKALLVAVAVGMAIEYGLSKVVSMSPAGKFVAMVKAVPAAVMSVVKANEAPKA